jgi:NAD(P)-dependent dehydrogenase (short-subunit alcohol dehydrogenase family)
MRPVRSGSGILVFGQESEIGERVASIFANAGFYSIFMDLDSACAASLPEEVSGVLVLGSITGEKPADEAFLLSSLNLAKRFHGKLEDGSLDCHKFFATVTFNGGLFGIHGMKPSADVVAAGLHGLSKTAGHEWQTVSCKAIDVDSAIDHDMLAQQIVDACLTGGSEEIGITPDGPITIECVRRPFPGVRGKNLLGKEDVVVVTGGARGVTAEVAVGIAERFQAKLLLLGRSPIPEQEPHWLLGITDPAAMKKAIIRHGDQTLTLKDVDAKYQQILASREMQQNFDRIRSAGTRFIYRQVDVQQAANVTDVIKDAEALLGPVTAVVHGAGILRDRLIKDKTDEQFLAVYRTKIQGLESVLAALNLENLKALVVFSSSTGRLGRKGQVDYAMANEVLNKFAEKFAMDFPRCRVVAPNWGPWDGGMVTDSLKKIFDAEGVPVIPLDRGAHYLVEELCQEGTERLVETVVLGTVEGVGAFANLAENREFSAAFDRELTIGTHPFLASHVIKGRAVLPAAMMIEWMAEAALLSHPGVVFHGFDDFKVLKGITLAGPESVRIAVNFNSGISEDGIKPVYCEIRSQGASGTVCHASATIIIGAAELSPRDPVVLAESQPYEFTMEVAYRRWLFHGPAMQGLDRVIGCSKRGISGVALRGPRPAQWMADPQRTSWVLDPLVLDVAFQLMILWSTEQFATGCLPCAIKSYRQYARSFPKTVTQINGLARGAKTSNIVEADLEFVDSSGQLIASMHGYQGIRDRSLVEAFSQRSLVAPEATI